MWCRGVAGCSRWKWRGRTVPDSVAGVYGCGDRGAEGGQGNASPSPPRSPSPPPLMAEEPTTGLDVLALRRLLDLLARLAELGLALIVISHDARVLSYLATASSGCPIVRARSGTPRGRSPGARATAIERGRPAGSRAGPAQCQRDVSLLRPARTPRRRAVRRPPARRARRDRRPRRPAAVPAKSTIALLALGLVQPSAGEVWAGDQPLVGSARGSFVASERGSDLIFQNAYDAMPEAWPARRVLAEPLERRRERPIHAGPPRGARAGRAATCGGLPRSPAVLVVWRERQRLALARAIVACPRLVIADEPTSTLDADLREELIDHMRAMRDRTARRFSSSPTIFGRARLLRPYGYAAPGPIVEQGRADVVSSPRGARRRGCCWSLRAVRTGAILGNPEDAVVRRNGDRHDQPMKPLLVLDAQTSAVASHDHLVVGEDLEVIDLDERRQPISIATPPCWSPTWSTSSSSERTPPGGVLPGRRGRLRVLRRPARAWLPGSGD